MATSNRGGSRGSNRNRGRNNNPERRNQYSGIVSGARDNPLATAAAVGGAIAAGIFLWSRRSQISDQISELADQISDLREGTGPSGDFGISRSGDTRSQTQIAEEALTLKQMGQIK